MRGVAAHKARWWVSDALTFRWQVGDLHPFADESWLAHAFASVPGLVGCKVIRSRLSGQSEGFGFVSFASHELADSALRSLNGQASPGGGAPLRLNWAAGSGAGGGGGRRGGWSWAGSEVGVPWGPNTTSAPHPEEHSLFAGDLAPDVGDAQLADAFRQRYPSVRSAKVVTEAHTGRSKGFGFVRFGDAAERDEAMRDMTGAPCGPSGRPMRVSLAQPRRQGGPPAGSPSWGFHAAGAAMLTPGSPPSGTYPPFAASQPLDGALDHNNCTVFVGGLDPQVSEDALRSLFAQYGDLVYVKIPPGKNCGFVQFVHRACAEQAIAAANGTTLGRQQMRLSWGRSNATRGGAYHGAAVGGGYAYGYGQSLPAYGPSGVYYGPATYPYAYEQWNAAQAAAAQYAQYAAAHTFAQQAAAATNATPTSSPTPSMTAMPRVSAGAATPAAAAVATASMAMPIPLSAPRDESSASVDAPAESPGVDKASEALRALLLRPSGSDSAGTGGPTAEEAVSPEKC